MIMELCMVTHTSAMEYTKLSIRQFRIMRDACVAVMKRMRRD